MDRGRRSDASARSKCPKEVQRFRSRTFGCLSCSAPFSTLDWRASVCSCYWPQIVDSGPLQAIRHLVLAPTAASPCSVQVHRKRTASSRLVQRRCWLPLSTSTLDWGGHVRHRLPCPYKGTGGLSQSYWLEDWLNWSAASTKQVIFQRSSPLVRHFTWIPLTCRFGFLDVQNLRHHSWSFSLSSRFSRLTKIAGSQFCLASDAVGRVPLVPWVYPMPFV